MNSEQVRILKGAESISGHHLDVSEILRERTWNLSQDLSQFGVSKSCNNAGMWFTL